MLESLHSVILFMVSWCRRSSSEAIVSDGPGLFAIIWQNNESKGVSTGAKKTRIDQVYSVNFSKNHSDPVTLTKRNDFCFLMYEP